MSLIRKNSLEQLKDIQNMIDKIGDIGEETTKNVKDYYDYHNDTDIDSDVLLDMSNEIQKTSLNKNPDMAYITRAGQGNLGECMGDLTDQEFANNYFQHNPLSDSHVDTIEEFDIQYWFNGSTFKKNITPKDKLKKIDENYIYNTNKIHLKRFDEF